MIKIVAEVIDSEEPTALVIRLDTFLICRRGRRQMSVMK
jgi:hypothetical protein